MPVYKDTEKNTWYTQFYYQTWTGERKKKFKRGFIRKKEAQDFEREFLEKQQTNPDMTFGVLTDLYLDDLGNRLKLNTMETKRYIINLKILPYFKDKPLNSIKPTDIRKWQNVLLNMGYSETYLKTVNNQIVAILNYAVRYYGLKENPCHKAGSMGKKNADEMLFWMPSEFDQFIVAVKDKPLSHMAFKVLFWTGIRIGELMALTPSDIDFNNSQLAINKSYQRIKQQDIITVPKTPKSIRVVSIDDELKDDLEEYLKVSYDLEPNDRLFPFTKHYLTHEMRRGCKISGVKKIRLHDLRHSHASLLIELGFSPKLIADRLGHEKIETTMNTYSHLFPNKQSQVADAIKKHKLESK